MPAARHLYRQRRQRVGGWPYLASSVLRGNRTIVGLTGSVRLHGGWCHAGGNQFSALCFAEARQRMLRAMTFCHAADALCAVHGEVCRRAQAVRDPAVYAQRVSG